MVEKVGGEGQSLPASARPPCGSSIVIPNRVTLDGIALIPRGLDKDYFPAGTVQISRYYVPWEWRLSRRCGITAE